MTQAAETVVKTEQIEEEILPETEETVAQPAQPAKKRARPEPKSKTEEETLPSTEEVPAGPAKKRARPEPKAKAPKAAPKARPASRAKKVAADAEDAEKDAESKDAEDAESKDAESKDAEGNGAEDTPGTEPAKQFIVQSTVRQYVKDSLGMKTSGAFLTCLNALVKQSIHAAKGRAEKNGRVTILGPDA
jgi:membrane protein involved in colicin uptake